MKRRKKRIVVEYMLTTTEKRHYHHQKAFSGIDNDDVKKFIESQLADDVTIDYISFSESLNKNAV
jgi:hypothetical protein